MGVTLLEELALLEAVKPSSCLSVYPCDVPSSFGSLSCPVPIFFFFLADRLEQSHECFKSKVDT